MIILITGGAGFLGGSLASILSLQIKTIITYSTSPVNQNGHFILLHLDITDKKKVEDLFCRYRPDVIIHTAAIANAAICENNKQYACSVNVCGVENIAIAAEKVNARLIYISTDNVFSGNKKFYAEEDGAEPSCFYGRTKLDGENIVISVCSDYCIARISLVYGISANLSKCFAEKIMIDLMNNKEVELFIDEYRSPIYLNNLCDILMELALCKEFQGLYHICGSKRVSRYEFGLKMAEIFHFSNELIVPISISEVDFRYYRPADCSMINLKVSKLLKTRIWSLDEGLLHMKVLSEEYDQ